LTIMIMGGQKKLVKPPIHKDFHKATLCGAFFTSQC